MEKLEVVGSIKPICVHMRSGQGVSWIIIWNYLELKLYLFIYPGETVGGRDQYHLGNSNMILDCSTFLVNERVMRTVRPDR